MTASEPRVCKGGNAWRVVRQVLAFSLLVTSCVGCAIHYYDKETGTEHLWGFGHLKMRAVPRAGDASHAPTNAAGAFVTGVRTLGFSMGAGQEFAGLAAGWDSRSRVIIAAENAEFCLLWPSNTIWLPRDLQDLFTLRLGEPPTNFLFQSTPTPLKP